MLTVAQVKQYENDGFIVVHDVFDAEIIQRLRRITDELVKKSCSLTESDKVYDLAPNHTAERPRVRRIKTPHLVDPVFQELTAYPGLVAILQQLMGPDIRFDSSKLNLKEAHHGEPVEWHQDWAFYPHTNDDLLAVGLMLDNCELENGPLMIIPGSHKGPNYNHHDDEGYFCGAMDPSACDIDFSKAVPCVGKAGSISIHHVRAVHGSAENTSNSPRRLLLYQMCAADAWPLMGISNLQDYDKKMLVGESTIQPRLENVPVIMPLPPARNAGSIYANQVALKNRYFSSSEATAQM